MKVMKGKILCDVILFCNTLLSLLSGHQIIGLLLKAENFTENLTHG